MPLSHSEVNLTFSEVSWFHFFNFPKKLHYFPVLVFIPTGLHNTILILVLTVAFMFSAYIE